MKRIVTISLMLLATSPCLPASQQPIALPFGNTRQIAPTDRKVRSVLPTVAPAVVAELQIYGTLGESVERRFAAKSPNIVNSKGVLVDVTRRDFQANSTIGRMVAVPNAGPARVQFTYVRRQVTNNYNLWGFAGWDASVGGWSPGGTNVVQDQYTTEAGAYPRIAVLNDGRAILGGYDTYDGSVAAPNYQLHAVWDQGQPYGSFQDIDGGSRMSDALESSQNLHPGTQSVWPTIDISYHDDQIVTYLATYETGGNSIGAMKVYRKIGLNEGNPDLAWQIVFVDTATWPSQDISCSPISTKVGVAWLKYTSTNPSQDQYDQDVWYAESPSGVAGTWTRSNVTNYSGATYRAYLELSSLYDHSDRFHIIWNGRAMDAASGDFYGRACQLFHWSQWLPSQIQTVYNAEWDASLAYCHGNSNTMNIAHFSLAECANRLYVAFTSYNDVTQGYRDDCGQSTPYANGDIYISASDSLPGLHWESRPHNVSQSFSPNCLAGDCADDGYSSLSRYGLVSAGSAVWPESSAVDPSGTYAGNEHVQLFYLTDRDPGAENLGQSSVTDNDLRWLRLACYDPFPFRLTLSPSQLSSPLVVQPERQQDFHIQINSLGAESVIIQGATITSQWNSGPGLIDFLEISFPTSVLLPGFGSTSGSLRVSLGNVDPGTQLHADVIVVWTNSTATVTDTSSLTVDLTVADPDGKYPFYQVLSTGCLNLEVGTDGDAGLTGGLLGGLHFIPGIECDSGQNSRGEARTYLYDASPVVLRWTGSSYRGSWSFFQSGDTTNPHEFRRLSAMAVPQFGSTAEYDSISTGQILSRDSLVVVERTWYAPKAPDSCDMVLQKTTFCALNSTLPVSNLVLGEVFDWDIPTDVQAPGNTGGYDASSRLVWFRGYNSLAPDNDCENNGERYGGTAYLWSHFKDSVLDSTTFSAFYASNWDYIFPGTDYVDSRLWTNMALAGTPSITFPNRDDLHGAIRYRTAPFVLPANDTLTVWTVIASAKTPTTGSARLTEATGGLAQLIASIVKAKKWYEHLVPPAGCCAGNVGNVDCDLTDGVDVGDLTTLIDNLFINFTPLCCEAEANCDGVGGIDVGDLTSLIDNLFINFPPLPACH